MPPKTTKTKEAPASTATEIPTAEVKKGNEVAVAKPQAPRKRSLKEQLDVRGISDAAWHTLQNSLFPGAKTESILLAIDYCKARNLDVLKKPCHIVPMEVKINGDYVWRDVVLPGIYEHRTTAHRTGKYLGHSEPVFGEYNDFYGVEAPMWCSMVFKRATDHGVAEFPVVVFFNEVVGLKDRGTKVNQRWERAPRQMLVKCTEAAGLREAFPEELGGQHTMEEADTLGRLEVLPGATEDGSPPAMGGTGADASEMNRELGLESAAKVAEDELERMVDDVQQAIAEGDGETTETQP